MSSETLRPNGNAYVTGLTYSSGSSAYVLLNDNSDASYVIEDSSSDRVTVDFGACTFPAGAVVLSVTPRVRAAVTSSTGSIRVLTGKGSTGTYSLATVGSLEYVTLTTSITTFTFAAQPYAFGTTSKWTETDLNALQMQLYPNNVLTNRIYELYLDVKYAEAPTVGSVAIDSNIVSTPTVTWLYTAGSDGGPQARYEIKIFDSATYGGGGFSADTSTATYSETGYGALSSKQIPGGYLVAGTTYKVYVRVAADTNGDYQTSTTWASSSGFTFSPDPPGTPTLTVTPDSTNFRAALALQGHDNVMTEQDSSFETSVGTFLPVLGSSTLLQWTTRAVSPGTGSLKLTSTGAGDASAISVNGTSGYPVAAGRQYRVRGSARAEATTRTCEVQIVWYDSGGSLISQVSVGTASITSSGFTEIAATMTAPTGATYAALLVAVKSAAGASEVFSWDHLGIQEVAGSAPSAWTRGGFFSPSVTAQLYCKIQYQDAGSTDWTTVRGCSALQPGTNQAYTTVYDTALQPGVTRTYRAIEYYTESGSTTEGSAAAGSQTVNLDLTTWLLRCPADPTLDMVVRVRDEGELVRRIPQGSFDILGAADPVVVYDVAHDVETTMVLVTKTTGEADALEALLRAGEILFLASPSSHGGVARYLFPGQYSSKRANPMVPTDPSKFWTVPYTQVAEPA